MTVDPIFPEHAAAVAPSNTVDLDPYARFLVVTAAGIVSVDMVGGETAVLVQLAAGIVAPMRVKRVRVTGTTATGIVALW